MDATEYRAAVEKLAAWNARDQDYQRRLKELAAEIQTVTNNRRNNKSQYGELLAKAQETLPLPGPQTPFSATSLLRP